MKVYDPDLVKKAEFLHMLIKDGGLSKEEVEKAKTKLIAIIDQF